MWYAQPLPFFRLFFSFFCTLVLTGGPCDLTLLGAHLTYRSLALCVCHRGFTLLAGPCINEQVLGPLALTQVEGFS